MSDMPQVDRRQDPPSQTLNIFGGILALGMLGLLWWLSWAFVFEKIPTENTSNISQITGAVLLQVGIIIGWYYRSSQEAKKQADTISTLVSAQTAAPKTVTKVTPEGTTTTTTTPSTDSTKPSV